MSTITELLDKMKTVVLGRDMRQTIIDAIQQCYMDGKAGSIEQDTWTSIHDWR